MRGITAQLSPTPLPRRESAVGDVLGNHRSVCACLSAPVSIFDNEGLPDPEPLGISARLLDAREARTKSVCHGINTPRLTFIETDRPKLRLSVAVCQATARKMLQRFGGLRFAKGRASHLRDR